MTVQVVLNTPLAEALGNAIQPKLLEVGWGSGSADDAALAEYIVLMLVNGRNQDQIATELSNDLLNLGPDDPDAKAFAGWLFEQAELLNVQLNGGSQPTETEQTATLSQGGSATGDFDTDMGASGDVPELNAPTGPRSMRNGNGHSIRGAGRDKRLLGQMTKAMDRTSDSVLHRVRGNDRINSHARGPPSGPRGGIGRPARGMNGRGGANIQAGLNAMAGMGGPGLQGMSNMNGAWGMPAGQPPNQLDLYAMLEQQSRMMEQLSQQMLNTGGGGGGGFNQQRPGKSLFDRVQNPRRGNFRNGQQHRGDRSEPAHIEGQAEGEDVEMGQKREAPNPDETICKYNLHCTNRECKFAHQSPAAPPGITIDVSDICTFGAACKNKKCVGRHPSPAARLAHQSEQDCKFYPNCTNARCPFRHPSMPVCRNGADCTTPNCKFTHVKTKCKFNPCLNPNCAFVHEDGQQGGFKDKVWVAGSGEHVSERKFVDDNAENEVIISEGDNAMGQDQSAAQDIVT